MLHPKNLVVLLAFFALAVRAGDASPQRASDPKKTSIEYRLYSGSVPDTDEPTRGDAKVSISLTGRTAKDLFDHMGREVRDNVCTEPGTRTRTSRNQKVACLRSARGEYRCAIGVDLKSGETDVGMVC